MKNIYFDAVISQIPRLLSLLDKNPVSSTFGCFDREFWHYATTDCPSARKQEAVLTLALLYKMKYPKNPYFKSEKISCCHQDSVRHLSFGKLLNLLDYIRYVVL